MVIPSGFKKRKQKNGSDIYQSDYQYSLRSFSSQTGDQDAR